MIADAVKALCWPLIREFERGPEGSFAATAYPDVAGNYTIGWGHKCTTNDPLLLQTIDEPKANALCEADLNRQNDYLEACLGTISWDLLKPSQQAALVDFVFNLGIGTFERSSMHHFIVENRMDRVPDEFGRWVYGAGHVMAGLVRRREAEKALWLAE